MTDTKLLQAKMEPLKDLDGLSGRSIGSGSVVAIANTGQSTLLQLIYKLGAQHVAVTDKAFDTNGATLPAGSLLLTGVPDSQLQPLLKTLSLDALHLSTAPSVSTHPAAAPRIAFMHTWLSTQTEGWWRYAFDQAGVPYDYISTQTVGSLADLRAKYDVIIFAPVGRASSEQLLNGMPMYANALPWQKTDLTPNIGRLDSTADMRPGLGTEGLAHLQDFVTKGGLLITCEDTAQFAIDMGLAPGVTVAPHADARVVGSVLRSALVDKASPVLFGYTDAPAVMSADGMVFNVSNTVGRGGGRVLMDPYDQRPTGRGGVGDPDVPQGRKNVEPDPLPKYKAWQPRPLNEEQMRNNPNVIPAQFRPDVILRLGEAKGLLVSGLLDRAGSIAEHAVVVDAHVGEGNVLLFGNNPVYRGETVGSYPLVFNALMNFNQLSRKNPDAGK